MKCPHCLTTIHDEEKPALIGRDTEGFWAISVQTCPACNKMIVFLGEAQVAHTHDGKAVFNSFRSKRLVRPRAAGRPPAPPEVPKDLGEDYNEACMVISDSPQASAALSRRCLQALLRGHAGVKQSDLSKEIQEVIDSGKLPSHISDALDAVRNIGNFAAHPIKSTTSGSVHKVEPGEAEWTLEVLESLFDFYFVQPETLRKRRAALDAKLADAGKPPMKKR